MKKQFILGIFAAVSLLFAASCTPEEPCATNGGVRITLNKPRAATETTSDGTKNTILAYTVYDKGGVAIAELSGVNNNAFNGTLSETVDMKLVKGQEYTIVFWAQNGACTAYNYSDLKNITIDYDKLAGNSEDNDAFFGAITVVVSNQSGQLNETVTLRRPFAQLNFAVTETEYATVLAAQAQVTESKVEVKELATGFNAMTGAITGTAIKNFAFDFSAIPTEGFSLTDATGTETAYKRLSMNYLLVNDGSTQGDAGALTDVKFTLKTNHNDIVIESTSTPLQRNYRTNVLGSLLNPAQFTVIVDPIYADTINMEPTENPADEPTLKERIEAGGKLSIDEPVAALDFSEFTLSQPVHLCLNAPVGEIKLGGNNGGAADAPAVTIEVTSGVAYPTFLFNENAYNVTLKGVAGSSKKMSTPLLLNNAKNITIDGIAFSYKPTADNQYTIEAINTDVENLTIQNCVADDLGQSFAKIDGHNIKNVTIKHNTLTCLDGSRASVIQREQDPLYIRYASNVWIEGNTITNSCDHHAIYVSDCTSDVTITNNTVNNAYEDAIKVDRSTKVYITNNTLDATNNGIRFDNLNADATYVVTGNTVSTLSSSCYALNLKKGSVSVHLTAKENKVGTRGIKQYVYVNPTITLSGDYEAPFLIADGVSVAIDGAYALSNVNGMLWFAKQVNSKGNTFVGQTLKLTADLDLKNQDWEPIGQTKATEFKGVFDGQKHTIYNLHIDSEAETGGEYSSGLFGWIESHDSEGITIKNLNIVGATVKGHHNVAAIAGYLIGTIENCHVTDAEIVCTHANDNACGDKAGVIAGIAAETNALITGCSAKNSTVKAGRDAGQIVGACIVGKVENCSADNVTVSATAGCTHKNIREDLIGRTE